MCAICNRRFVEGHEQEDLDWVGCEYEMCGKWFHGVCVGMTHEEVQKMNEEGRTWFCSGECKKEHS